jgi:hypothetical protein
MKTAFEQRAIRPRDGAPQAGQSCADARWDGETGRSGSQFYMAVVVAQLVGLRLARAPAPKDPPL